MTSRPLNGGGVPVNFFATNNPPVPNHPPGQVGALFNPFLNSNNTVQNNSALRSQNNRANDGFETVDYRRNKRKPPVYGTKSTPTTHNNKRMAGERTERQFSLFIGGVNKDFSVADMESYIKDELGINVIAVDVIKINQNNRSFKVTVPKRNKDVMFDPSNWDESIILKPFRERNTTISNESTRFSNNAPRFGNSTITSSTLSELPTSRENINYGFVRWPTS